MARNGSPDARRDPGLAAILGNVPPSDGPGPDHPSARRSWQRPAPHVGRAVVIDTRRAHLTVPTVADHVGHVWDADIVPTLEEYIRIPNVSPAFDPEWATTGHMDRAAELVRDWVGGATDRRSAGDDRTPAGAHTADRRRGTADRPGCNGHGPALRPHRQAAGDGGLARGHRPVEPGDRGRAALRARRRRRRLRRVRSDQRNRGGASHERTARSLHRPDRGERGVSAAPISRSTSTRCAERIGQPDLVVCLDSGCGDYDRLWLTTSLRGLVAVDLTRPGAAEGVHSGAAGGVVPSTFRVLRRLARSDRGRGHREVATSRSSTCRCPTIERTSWPRRRRSSATTSLASSRSPSGAQPVAAGDALRNSRRRRGSPRSS